MIVGFFFGQCASEDWKVPLVMAPVTELLHWIILSEAQERLNINTWERYTVYGKNMTACMPYTYIHSNQRHFKGQANDKHCKSKVFFFFTMGRECYPDTVDWFYTWTKAMKIINGNKNPNSLERSSSPSTVFFFTLWCAGTLRSYPALICVSRWPHCNYHWNGWHMRG